MAAIILAAFGGSYWKGQTAGYEKASLECHERFAKLKADQDAANRKTREELEALEKANEAALAEAEKSSAQILEEEVRQNALTVEYLKLRFSQQTTSCLIEPDDIKFLE